MIPLNNKDDHIPYDTKRWLSIIKAIVPKLQTNALKWDFFITNSDEIYYTQKFWTDDFKLARYFFISPLPLVLFLI